MPRMATSRLFVAVPLGEEVALDLGRFMGRVEHPSLRMAAAENLHVTLKFLGEVEHDAIGGVRRAIGEAVSEEGVERFELRSRGLTVLPDARRPRVLALETEVPGEMRRLVEGLESRLMAIGFPREGRAFRSHVTLGRFRDGRGEGKAKRGDGRVWRFEVSEYESPEWVMEVERIVLMQSVLEREGPVYSEVEEYGLR